MRCSLRSSASKRVAPRPTRPASWWRCPMSQSRALIAEDEPRLREQLAERLSKLWPELELSAMVGDGMEAVQALDRYQPNILFLDIQMPGLSGLEVARYASNRCHVASIAAYDEYTDAACRAGA